MSKMSERKRLFLTIGVAVLIAGVLLYLIYQDREEIKSIETEISSIEDRIRAADKEIRKTKKREDAVLVFRAVEERELAILPTEQHITDFHRNLSSFLAASDIHFQELPESKPEESALAKGIYVTRNTIKGQGSAAAILKFMNMVENDPRLVAVKGFEVHAGKRDDEAPNLPIEHSCEVMLETYFYRPADAKFEAVHIPGALKRLQQPDVRQQIASFQPERPDTYVLRPMSSRRDPLVDPRQYATKDDPAEYEEEFKKQEELILPIEGRHSELAEMIVLERELIDKHDIFRANQMGLQIAERVSALQSEIASLEDMKTITIPELAKRLSVVKDAVTRISRSRPKTELVVTRLVAERVHGDINTKFNEGQHEEVARLAQQWATFLRGKEVRPGARRFLDEIERIRDKSKNQADFASLDFSVSGVIVHPRNPQRSLAIVNKRRVKVGDALDEADEVTVAQITSKTLWVRFRGEEHEIPVRAVGKKNKGAASRSRGTLMRGTRRR